MPGSRRYGGDSSVGYEDSWYYHSAGEIPSYAALDQDCKVDVAIIGAGYTGLSAAIELAKNKVNVAVLEAHKVGAGASGRNGGVLGTGQRKDQLELEQWLGQDAAKKMWQIAVEANQLVRQRVDHYEIDCDLRDGGLTVAHRERHETGLWDYADYLEQHYGYTAKEKVNREEVAEILGVDSFFGGYIDSNVAHIQPLKLSLGLARAAGQEGAVIHEHSTVQSIVQQGSRILLKTDKATLSADKVIIACNGYLGNLQRDAAVYQMPINNFILATEPLGEARAREINRRDLAVVDTRFVVNYFHNSPDHRLIFGGGENYSSRFPSDLKRFVRRHMLEVYPQLADVKIDFAWGGTLAVTMKRMPHFGRKADSIYWAQGYSGHGIAMANMGGKLVADAIMKQAEGFDLYARLPHQKFPGGVLLRWPGLVAGMLYYSMLDRL